MEMTLTMDNLSNMLLNLPIDNRKWLIGKLQDSVRIEEESEYISKDEILSGIRKGLNEVKTAQIKGLKQKTLQEVIDGL